MEMTCSEIIGGDDPELEELDDPTRIPPGRGIRLRCCNCHAVHRELPDFIFPYKQYEADIIIGVLEGLITCETLGFEDYPCEMTMIRWHLFPPRLFLLTAVPNLK